MATQVEKLQKVKEIKTSIKDVINANGGNVGEVFSEYPLVIEEQLGALGDVKETLVEKGLADENTKSSEYGEIIKGITPLKELLDFTKSTAYMFYNNKYALSDIESVDDVISYNDTENVTDMNNMFYRYTNLKRLPLLNTSKVTDMSYFFSSGGNATYKNEYITEFPFYDTSNVENMQGMFKDLPKLKTIPLLNTSKVTNMSQLFGDVISNVVYGKDLEEFPALDTKNVTTMYGAFSGCKELKTIPLIITSKVENMQATFSNTIKLELLPELDYSNVTSMYETFYQSNAIREIKLNDTSKVTNFSKTFYNCYELVTVGTIDFISTTSSPSDIFRSCIKLTNLTIKNLKVNLTIGSGTSWGRLLTVDSLINTCKECINTNYNRTLTVGSANLEKLANVYVKFTDTTQTTIATNQKGEIEVCESTDEGAMTITEYMALKKWTLA